MATGWSLGLLLSLPSCVLSFSAPDFVSCLLVSGSSFWVGDSSLRFVFDVGFGFGRFSQYVISMGRF